MCERNRKKTYGNRNEDEGTELPGKADYGKTIRIDLRCRTTDGTDIIVEMQNYPQCYFFRLCVGYA